MNKILIVDDDVAIAIEFEEYLPTLGYDIVGTAADGEEAISLAITRNPDIVLMDIGLPGKMDGIQASSLIKEMGCGIIFVSGYSDEELLERAKHIEPLGFIHKPFSENQVAATLKIAFHSLQLSKNGSEQAERKDHLSQKLSFSEMRIADLILSRKSTSDIAEILNISPATVIWHRKNIRKKLGIVGSAIDLRKSLLLLK
jgi:DNA-binding NarL/FixJ family response regulator